MLSCGLLVPPSWGSHLVYPDPAQHMHKRGSCWSCCRRHEIEGGAACVPFFDTHGSKGCAIWSHARTLQLLAPVLPCQGETFSTFPCLANPTAAQTPQLLVHTPAGCARGLPIGPIAQASGLMAASCALYSCSGHVQGSAKEPFQPGLYPACSARILPCTLLAPPDQAVTSQPN